jgi:hypothetical protein
VAAEHLSEIDGFVPPTDGFPATVYQHEIPDDREWATIGVVNPTFAATDGLGVSVSYRPAELPYLWHWRMLAPGMYVTGLEPANCGIRGRAIERAAGRVEVLQPSEVRRFRLRLEAHVGPDARALVGNLGGTTPTRTPPSPSNAEGSRV